MSGKSKMEIKGVVVGKDIHQVSDQDGTQMEISGGSAQSVTQRLVTKVQSIQIFGLRGSGLIAVICVAIVAILIVATNYHYK